MRVWPLVLMATEPDTRRRLREQVRAYPGMHLRAIARELGIQLNLAKYHLRRLEKVGDVSSRKEDGYWRFWPREEGSIGMRDHIDRRDKQILSFLRRPVPLRVVVHLLDAGQATHKELVAAVEVAYSTLHYHLGKLQEAGVVVAERDGREKVYRLQDPLHTRRLLKDYKPPRFLVKGFLQAWEDLEADLHR